MKKSDIYLKGEEKNPEWRESSLSNPFVLGWKQFNLTQVMKQENTEAKILLLYPDRLGLRNLVNNHLFWYVIFC